MTTEVLCDISQTLMAGATKKKYVSIRQSIFLMHPKFVSGSLEYNPPPPEYIPELLKDLEHFIKNESSICIPLKFAVTNNERPPGDYAILKTMNQEEQ